MRYHLIAAFFSNTIWFVTFRQLVKADMTLLFFAPYCAGTMLGSVFGVKISMWIESKLGAAADGHLKSKITADDLAGYWHYLETRRFGTTYEELKTFKEWFIKKDALCPVCKVNPIDKNRDGCRVDCSH